MDFIMCVIPGMYVCVCFLVLYFCLHRSLDSVVRVERSWGLQRTWREKWNDGMMVVVGVELRIEWKKILTFFPHSLTHFFSLARHDTSKWIESLGTRFCLSHTLFFSSLIFYFILYIVFSLVGCYYCCPFCFKLKAHRQKITLKLFTLLKGEG